MLRVEQEIHLSRELHLVEVALYGIGIIIGAGIYALLGSAIQLTGGSVWISFVIGAIIASFTGLSYAELSTLFPKAAAEYVYIKQAFQSNVLAFLIGWLILFTTLTAVATVSFGFAGYMQAFIHIPPFLIATGLIVLLSVINYLGIKTSTKINIIFTIIEVAGLVLISILAIPKIGHTPLQTYTQIPHGIPGIFAAAGVIFFAYIGFEDIANIAEETKSPQKVLPRAFLLAIGMSTLLYVLTAIAVIALAPQEILGTSTAPLAVAASYSMLGNYSFILLTLIAIISTASTVLATMIVHSRMIYGMAKQGSLPKVFQILDPKRKTPIIAIITLGIAAILFLLLRNITMLANLTSFSALLTFAFVNLSVIILRYSRSIKTQTFRVPLNIGKFPILSLCGFLSSVYLLLQFAHSIFIFAFFIIFSGFIIYFLLHHFRVIT